MSMSSFKSAIVVYISYKFGGLLSSTSAVNAAQLCTAGIDYHSVNLSTFTRGQHICASLLLARERLCYAWRAIRWALPLISCVIFSDTKKTNFN